MLLVSNFVRFIEPLGDLFVKVVGRANGEVVYVTSRPEFLDAIESRTFEPPGEDDVATHASRREAVNGGKDHPDLKPDASLCGSEGEWSASIHQFAETVEKLDGYGVFATKKSFDGMVSA
ncbi:MAG TPA: hypothetical protein VFZ49_03950 [Pyrinomonadaceae bacterium]